MSAHQKIMCVLRMLCYGTCGDTQDKYIQIGESTANLSMNFFCKAIAKEFKTQYLKSPDENDVNGLLEVNGERGFSGMLGSLDFIYWKYKNCPSGWARQYTRYKNYPTVILETVASQDLWIWHAFFGVSGSNNDVNVLYQGWFFNNLSNEIIPPCNNKIGTEPHTMGYYLSDRVYPKWQIIIQTIRNLMNDAENNFYKDARSIRKDVERAFRVLQARFELFAHGAWFWKLSNQANFIYTCIIMHNMIVEEERHTFILQVNIDLDLRRLLEGVNGVLNPIHALNTMAEYIAKINEIRDETAHFNLRDQLVGYLWTLKGVE